MNDILSVLEDLKIEEPLFQNVKFYVSGNAHEKVSVSLWDTISIFRVVYTGIMLCIVVFLLNRS